MNRTRFKIEYLPIAVRDLDEIFDYILKDNPSAAVGLVDNMETNISKLGDFPELGLVPKDDRLRFMGYRMLFVGEYIVFYVILEEAVEIRRIIHGKRRYSFLI
jgi:addiction module RelE/StbE family toxin